MKTPILFLTIFLILIGNIHYVKGQQHHNTNDDIILNVKKFGAAGDGKTDDYKALKAVTDSVNKLKHATVYFPKGSYYIAEYNDSTHNNYDLKYNNCNSVSIKGENAIIILNGNFKRTADIQGKGYKGSNENTVVPFYFVNCNNVSVSGIEINGDVNHMTRDNSVIEKGQGLITVMGCHNVTIENVYVHYSQSDGIYVGPTKNNTTNLVMNNVRSLNNARQGLSITGLRKAKIKSCTFNNTGYTGNYGFHRPAAGVDIEPTQIRDSIKTGDIVFEDCHFENNIGGQFLCTSPALTSNITIRNSVFTGVDSFSRYEVILAADSVLADNCSFNLKTGNIFPTWKSTPGSHVTISNSTINSSLNGILSASNDNSDTVVLRNNTFNFTGDSLKSYFPYLQTKNLYFLNNKVYIPTKTIKLKSTHSLVTNAIVSEGNRFVSDDNAVKPKVTYNGTKKVNDQ